MSLTKVSSAMQDLTDDYAFTGSVTGAGKVLQVIQTHDTTARSQSLSANTRANISGLTAADGNKVALDETKVNTEMARLQAEYDSQEYARKRKAEYDRLNQFELISNDAIVGNGTSHRDAILAIKAKFPKPE